MTLFATSHPQKGSLRAFQFRRRENRSQAAGSVGAEVLGIEVNPKHGQEILRALVAPDLDQI